MNADILVKSTETTSTSGESNENDVAKVVGKDKDEYVWRFGYGSNIALTTLRNKKNLNPRRHLVGTIRGWELYFSTGIPYVEPGFAAVRPVQSYHNGDRIGNDEDDEEIHQLHGAAFLIPKDEADGLDKQEAAYQVLPSKFVAYDGEIVEKVGLYVPKKYFAAGDLSISTTAAANEPVKMGTPSLRYLGLLQQGAREAELSKAWIQKLDSFDHYVTPDDVRSQTLQWIEEFHNDPERKENMWTMEELSKHDGSDPDAYPPHVAVMQYVVKVGPTSWVFGSWKGHCVTRRNLVHFNGQSVDKNDIKWKEDGFRPLPKVCNCSNEEKEYLLQNLETILHRGGTIVARLQECIDDGGELNYC